MSSDKPSEGAPEKATRINKIGGPDLKENVSGAFILQQVQSSNDSPLPQSALGLLALESPESPPQMSPHLQRRMSRSPPRPLVLHASKEKSNDGTGSDMGDMKEHTTAFDPDDSLDSVDRKRGKKYPKRERRGSSFASVPPPLQPASMKSTVRPTELSYLSAESSSDSQPVSNTSSGHAAKKPFSPSGAERIAHFERLIGAKRVGSASSSQFSESPSKPPSLFHPVTKRDSGDESRERIKQRILMASAARSTMRRPIVPLPQSEEEELPEYTLYDYIQDKRGPAVTDSTLDSYVPLYIILIACVHFLLAVLILGLYYYGFKLVYANAPSEPSVGSMKERDFTLLLGILISFVAVVLVYGAAVYVIRYSEYGIKRYHRIFALAEKAEESMMKFKELGFLHEDHFKPFSFFNLKAHFTVYSLFKSIQAACAAVGSYRTFISNTQLSLFEKDPKMYFGAREALMKEELLPEGRETSMAPTINTGSLTGVASPLPNANNALTLAPKHPSSESSTKQNSEETPKIPLIDLNSPLKVAPPCDDEMPSALNRSMRPAVVLTQKLKERSMTGTNAHLLSMSPSRVFKEEYLSQTLNRTATFYRGGAADVDASLSRFPFMEESTVMPSAFRGESTMTLADTGVFTRPELELGPLVTFIVCRLYFSPSVFGDDGVVQKEDVSILEDISNQFHESVFDVANKTEGTVYDVRLDYAIIMYNALIPSPVTTAIIVAQQAELELATRLSRVQEIKEEAGIYFKWSLVLHQSRVANVAIREPYNHIMFASPEIEFASEVCSLSVVLNCPTLSLQPPHYEQEDITTLPIDLILGESDVFFLYKVRQVAASREVEQELGDCLIQGLNSLFELDLDAATKSFAAVAERDYSAALLYSLCEHLTAQKNSGKKLELQNSSNYVRSRPYWDFPEYIVSVLGLNYKNHVFEERPVVPLLPLKTTSLFRSASTVSTNVPENRSPRLLGDDSPKPRGTPMGSGQRRRRSSTVITIDSEVPNFMTRLQFTQRSSSQVEGSSPADVSITHCSEGSLADMNSATLLPHTLNKSDSELGLNDGTVTTTKSLASTVGSPRSPQLEDSHAEHMRTLFGPKKRNPSKSVLSIMSSDGSKGPSKKVIVHRRQQKDLTPIVTASSFAEVREVPSEASFQESTSTSKVMEFTIGMLIGTGTGGREVFQGLDDRGRIVAIKQIPVEENSKGVEDANREIETLSSLKHENIVRYIASYYEEPYLYIMMEHVSGGTLTGFLENFGGKLPYEVVRRYAIGILKGLRYLHSKGIVHRDISLNNVLVTIDGVCKLSDFGGSIGTIGKDDLHIGNDFKPIATSASGFPSNLFSPRDDRSESETQVVTDTIFGTPIYMSPQACQGIVDARNDIWSVGIVLCYCITGRPPWEDEDMEDRSLFLSNIASGKITPIIPYSHVSTKLASFLEKCLKPSMKERPSAAQLLLDPFTAQL
ncbi:hypothetical protein AGDE_12761 [Angomonas deanei]|nr:hypothetical protein AGDE_12761 [Angomonas deanei]|eukprot:EPY23555.1 hypothetical protein AGDE_12761 [Angomonas deanei]